MDFYLQDKSPEWTFIFRIKVPEKCFFKKNEKNRKKLSNLQEETPEIKNFLSNNVPQKSEDFLPDENFKFGTFFLGHREFIPAKSDNFDIPIWNFHCLTSGV